MSAWFGWRPGAFQGWYSTTTTVITGYDVQCWASQAWLSNCWDPAAWVLTAIPVIITRPTVPLSRKLPTYLVPVTKFRNTQQWK